MKIRNINVSDNFISKISDLEILQFILEVIRPLEKELYSKYDIELYCRHPENIKSEAEDIRKISLCGYENIATLVHTIPIFLKDKGESPEENLELEGEKSIDLLGAYYQNIGKNNESKPYIELYVDRIYDLANNDDKTFKWLFAKTLIHELAHAVLDNYNTHFHYRHVNKISYNTDFGKWREESMANAIALRIIKDFGDIRFFDYAIKFMWSQPREYALGVLMEDFHYLDMRSVIDNKYEGVSQDLQDEWMNYVQGNPDCEGLKQWNKKLLGLE